MSTTTKMLWLFIVLVGPLNTSQRGLAFRIGISQRAVSQNLAKLAHAQLVSYEPVTNRYSRSSVQAIGSIFDGIEISMTPTLRETNSSTKLLYLWLAPQGEVTYTHKEVASKLGITEVTAVKARQALERVDAIIYTRRPSPRSHGIYRVVSPSKLDQSPGKLSELAFPGEISLGHVVELKLYWLLRHRIDVTAHQQTLALLLDVSQSAVSKAVRSLNSHGLIKRKVRRGQERLMLAGIDGSNRRENRGDVMPLVLRGEANSVQLVYLWLSVAKEVRSTYSEFANLLRVRKHSVIMAMTRLEELGMLEILARPSDRKRGHIKLLEPDDEQE